MSVEDELCEAIYKQTSIRRDDGRELGESQKVAVRRLMQMEKRGHQHKQMFEGYKSFIR